MKQYIDKDALAAEIERRIKTLNEILSRRSISWPTLEKLIEENKKVLSFLGTLEVKEVNLDKEIDLVEDKYHGFESLSRADIIDVAKHFFELGLKAQIMTSKLQQRISVLKMSFWTGLQTFEETEMTLSDAYNQGVDDILEELGIKAQKGK